MTKKKPAWFGFAEAGFNQAPFFAGTQKDFLKADAIKRGGPAAKQEGARSRRVPTIYGATTV
jgi:hypothetical protein